MDREERLARNEVIARNINEDIEESLKSNTRLSNLVLICECGDASCEDAITLTTEEYETIRRNPRHFAVAKGHIFPDIEVVVRETTNIVVVEKRQGIPAAVAEGKIAPSSRLGSSAAVPSHFSGAIPGQPHYSQECLTF